MDLLNNKRLMKYEYRILQNKPWWKSALTDENFNKLGEEGFDLVKLDILHQVAYFKKIIK